jgi:hypothetical protein
MVRKCIKMEKIQTILSGQEVLDRIKEQAELPIEMQRYLFFSRKLHDVSVTSRAETETHVYWSYQVKTPRFENDRLFYTSKNNQGATYDKTTRTMKIWFDKKFIELIPDIQDDMVKMFKFDWYSSLSSALKTIMTKSLLNRVIKGKITNPRDLVKAYIKTSSYRTIDIAPETFFKYFNNSNATAPIAVRRHLEYSTNPELSLQRASQYNYTLEDMYRQAAILNEKVNPTWSDKRMAEVHYEWTRRIMELSIKELKPYSYDYNVDSIDFPEGISIINTNLELFEEGTTMKHCVYTNYEYQTRSKNYFVLRYNRNGVRATVGINLHHRYSGDSCDAYIDQMYSIANSAVPNEDREYVENWLANDLVKQWFRNEQKIKNEIPCVDLI